MNFNLATLRFAAAAFLVVTTASRAASLDLDLDPMASAFDAAVDLGLPATVDVPTPARLMDNGISSGTKRLRVETSLPARVRFPGKNEGSIYSGTLDDRHVLITRWADRLVVSRDERADAHTQDSGRRRLPRSLPEDKAKDVDIHLFVHDDVQGHMTREAIHADYVAWWVEDVTALFPDATVIVTYHPAIHGVTDMPYMHPRALAHWELVASQWAAMEDVDASHLTKYLLVTLHGPDKGVSGLALQGRHVAMASIMGRYRVIAHELGHLFGAEHADGEVRYSGGWWCESNMYGTPFALRSNCYRYSEASRRRIRDYAIRGPGDDDGGQQGMAIVD
jgi:hypothetical protein